MARLRSRRHERFLLSVLRLRRIAVHRGRTGPGSFQSFSFGAKPRPQKAPDLSADVRITLEEAMKGTKRRLELTAEDECPVCAGSGMVAAEQKQGKSLIRSAQPCSNCGGSGVIPSRRTLEVSIPPGVTEGTRIRLKGQGGKGPRTDLNGDLFLTVHLEAHPVFAVAGRDLRVTLPVWDYEAGARRGSDGAAGRRRKDIAHDSRRESDR